MTRPLRVVVVGSGGRLGAAVARHLRQSPGQFRVVAYDHKAMDLLRPAAVEDHLCAIEFDALINCAAMTSIEQCEAQQDAATQINTTAVRQMAEICKARSSRMIQISTDYVYDGTIDAPRLESDATNPLSHYARTKLAADEAVLDVSSEFLTARTSWVFGPDRPAFIDQILSQAAKNAEVEAVMDKFSTPTYSIDAADWLAQLLAKPEVCGVLNLCNSGSASWNQYAQCALDKVRELGWPTKATVVRKTTLDGMKHFAAPRPRFSAMDSSKLARILHGQIRPWHDALHAYLQTYYRPNTTHSP